MKPLRHRSSLRLLACAGAAALLGGCDSSAAKMPRAAAPSARHAAAAVEPTPNARLQIALQKPAARAQPDSAAFTNVFAVTSWQPPPLPPPSPAARSPEAVAPAAPAAPPMPFRYIGRYGDADSQIVMLVKGDQLYLVAVGDTIDNAYRIERVSGTMVELTYLPLKLKQSLSTGDTG